MPLNERNFNNNIGNFIRPNALINSSAQGFDMLLSQTMSSGNNMTNNRSGIGANTANDNSATINARDNDRSTRDSNNRNNDTSNARVEQRETSDSQQDTTVNDSSNKAEESLDQNCLGALSEELEIPKEVLEQILIHLNMTLRQLEQPEKLNKFIQEVMEVETPMELLGIPNIAEIFENVKACLANEKVSVVDTRPTREFPKQLADIPIEESEEVVNIGITESNTEAAPVVKMETDVKSELYFQSEMQPEYNMMTSKTIEAIEFRSVLSKNEAAKNIDPKSVIKQVVEQLKVDIRPGATEIKMLLKPENLGEVALKVAMQNGIIVAEFIAQSERIKEILESNFNSLKEALQEQGLSVSELSVSVGNQDSNDSMQRFLHEQKKSEARISQIIKSISEEDLLESGELDQKEVLDNNVNYIA